MHYATHLHRGDFFDVVLKQSKTLPQTFLVQKVLKKKPTISFLLYKHNQLLQLSMV